MRARATSASRRGRPQGFTLIELLVVIAVITLLAALLFPVFAQAREKARSAACLSNLRQLGMAAQMYLDDYDGTFFWNPDPGGLPANSWSSLSNNSVASTTPVFPYRSAVCADEPTTSFVVLLQPYFKSHAVFHCPSYPGFTAFRYGGLYFRTPYGKSLDPVIDAGDGYAVNGVLIASYCRPRTAASLVHPPSEVALMGDSQGPWPAFGPSQYPPFNPGADWFCSPDGCYWYWHHWTEPPDQASASTGYLPRHHGGDNFVYVDGHTRFVRAVTPWQDDRSVPGAIGEAGYYPGAKVE